MRARRGGPRTAWAGSRRSVRRQYRWPRSYRTALARQPACMQAESRNLSFGTLRAVLATLERGIEAILSSAGFAAYLRAMARFHAYSARNVALIHAQRPEATRVAGY